ncbi:MAG: tail fiber protein [Planctomycetota bacterium]
MHAPFGPAVASLALLLSAVPAQSAAGAADTASTQPRYFWADYDGDGGVDVLVLTGRGVRLMRHVGGSDFADVTVDVGLAGMDAQPHLAAWADYDGDGRLDVFLASYTGASRLLRWTEAGLFEDVTDAVGLPQFAHPIDAAWHTDGDALPDLQLTTWNGEQFYRRVRNGFQRLDLGGAAALQQAHDAPATIDAARRQRGLPIITSRRLSTASTATGTCADRLRDVDSEGCFAASSTPRLGHLMPLNSHFNVDPVGRVGIGTTAPGTQLDVAGTARVQGLMLPNGASDGMVMTSDGSGRASWQPPLAGPPGPLGPQGPQGIQGPPGPPGSATLPPATGAAGSGTPVDHVPPFQAVHYVICHSFGVFPVRGPGGNPADAPMLGEIRAVAFDFEPVGYFACDGRLLSVTQHTALFALLGTQYGGDGRTTFALPDLRGRTILGAGSAPGRTARFAGDAGGAESTTLTEGHLAPHSHGIPTP